MVTFVLTGTYSPAQTRHLARSVEVVGLAQLGGQRVAGAREVLGGDGIEAFERARAGGHGFTLPEEPTYTRSGQ